MCSRTLVREIPHYRNDRHYHYYYCYVKKPSCTSNQLSDCSGAVSVKVLMLILLGNCVPQGSSPQAMSLAREIQGKLRELQGQTANAISSTERSGIRKPAPTVDGKVEQARQWLANPALDDKGLGRLEGLASYGDGDLSR